MVKLALASSSICRLDRKGREVGHPTKLIYWLERGQVGLGVELNLSLRPPRKGGEVGHPDEVNLLVRAWSSWTTTL